MTDPLHPGTGPEPAPLDPAPPTATDAEPPMPDYEVVELGTSAQAVARESGTHGAEAAGPRPSRARWAIALVGVALVGLVTAAIVALAVGRPSPSVAVGYMPEGVTQYTEVRLDLPGDQRQKLAGFLSVFPGFDDQAAIDTKLDETFDRLIGAATSNEQTYTADIEPWFGGQIAFGQGSVAPNGDEPSPEMFAGPAGLLVVSLKDRAIAADWIEDLGAGELVRSTYNGATLFSPSTTFGEPFAIAINDEVMLAGGDEAVKAAVDSNGNGRLAEDPEFKAAFGAVEKDYVVFTFTDYKASLAASMALIEGAGGPGEAAIAEEILGLVPGWFGSYGRFENDALVMEAAYPSVDIGVSGSDRKSSLLGMAPPGTVAFGELHDVGAALTALYDKVAQQPEIAEGIEGIEQQIGLDAAEIFGWWGDVALVASKDASGLLGAGVLITPTDAAAADRAFDVLRGFAVLGGGNAGVEVRDVEHGDATITVIDFSEAAGTDIDDLPDGYKAEVAYAVTDEVVVIGYGQAFVESVLDAGPGPSLADDARVSSLLQRVGDENLAFAFVDVRALREFFEPIARETMPADEWAHYETEIQPFLLPFDAFAGASHRDGSVDRQSGVITVTK